VNNLFVCYYQLIIADFLSQPVEDLADDCRSASAWEPRQDYCCIQFSNGQFGRLLQLVSEDI
jgi:hypothetical protein